MEGLLVKLSWHAASQRCPGCSEDWCGRDNQSEKDANLIKLFWTLLSNGDQLSFDLKYFSIILV